MLVSICVPIYNVSQYIERCTRSIFEQTYKNYEVIFVDDCSQDDSVQVLERVLLDYPDIKDKARILHHLHNRGLAAVRNTAVENAQGDFIMHVDSDDWLERDAIEKLVNKQKETDADIVSGAAICHYEEHRELLPAEVYPSKEVMILKMVDLTFDHVLWRRLIRSSLYKDHNIQAFEGFNVGEDHYTLPRLLYYANSYATIESVIFNYNRKNENSYININSWNSLVAKGWSDVLSLNILIDFFLGKSKKYVDETNRIKVKQCINFMHMSFLHQDRIHYSMFANQLLMIKSEYLSQFKFDNRLKIFFHKSFFSYSLYQKLLPLKELFRKAILIGTQALR